jgi:hypothetical protein
MDALYGELDELTAAAVRRHVESCSRCAPIYANLKAARDVATLPLEEPPEDLEDRILAAERAAQRSAPWHKKLVRAAAWAGSHAMRPQLAMAALFMFVIGSSLLLLRAKPGTFGPVSVSEKGAPAEEDRESARQSPAPVATAAAKSERAGRAADGKEPAAAAPGSPEKSLSDDAPKDVAEAPAPSVAASASAAIASLDETLELKQREGCAAALAKLEAIAGSDGKDADKAKRELEACKAEATPKSGGSPPAAPPEPTQKR